ncbi:MAG: response regulator [Anaerolineae bacterium]|nr:response regulator [Anaerolineae bacterium]
MSAEAVPAAVPEEFVGLVRDALAHLYDYAHLQRHPLVALASTGETTTDSARALRNLLLDTLEQLNPGDSLSRNDKEWRPYGVLVRRYVDGFPAEEIMEELHISLRQFQREHRKGLLAAASMLYDRWQQERQDTKPPVSQTLQEEMTSLGIVLGRVDLAPLIQDALGPAQALARGHGVHVEASLPPAPVWAWADPVLTRQALLAALSALVLPRPDHIAIRHAAGHDRLIVRLMVTPPIASTLRQGPHGLDARLTPVSELMQGQGGAVHLFPAIGPLEEVRLEFGQARGARVLVIDDNERVQQLFERYLTAEGFSVSSAADWSQALALIDQARPDAIVLDVMMREVDGWQLLQRLQSDAALGTIPVIVCSVLNEPELAAALGARHYLKKPVSQQQMLAAIRAALGESSQAEPPLAAP